MYFPFNLGFFIHLTVYSSENWMWWTVLRSIPANQADIRIIWSFITSFSSAEKIHSCLKCYFSLTSSLPLNSWMFKAVGEYSAIPGPLKFRSCNSSNLNDPIGWFLVPTEICEAIYESVYKAGNMPHSNWWLVVFRRKSSTDWNSEYKVASCSRVKIFSQLLLSAQHSQFADVVALWQTPWQPPFSCHNLFTYLCSTIDSGVNDGLHAMWLFLFLICGVKTLEEVLV